MRFFRFLKAQLWDGDNKFVIGFFVAWSFIIIINAVINPNWLLFSVLGFPFITVLAGSINQEYKKWKKENPK